jgi:pimeloyl-ACP methyl ester carboxylesterase
MSERTQIDWSQHISDSAEGFDFSAYEKPALVLGRRLNYVDIGDESKPVLLYVHGLAGTWKNWIFNLLPFADRYRVIAVDLPGFGDSEMPAGEFSLNKYVETLTALLDQLGIEKVTFVGNSMGGQIGAVFGKLAPERLTKLFLIDPAGFTTSGPVLKALQPTSFILDALMRFGARIRRFLAFNAFLAALFTKIVLFKPMQISGNLMLMLFEGIGKQGFKPAVKTIVNNPIKSFPGEITTDTVIVWGRQDALIPKSDAFRYAKLIPHAELELMDGVGHIPMFETPDRFNALIEEHLVKAPAADVAVAA